MGRAPEFWGAELRSGGGVELGFWGAEHKDFGERSTGILGINPGALGQRRGISRENGGRAGAARRVPGGILGGGCREPPGSAPPSSPPLFPPVRAGIRERFPILSAAFPRSLLEAAPGLIQDFRPAGFSLFSCCPPPPLPASLPGVASPPQTQQENFPIPGITRSRSLRRCRRLPLGTARAPSRFLGGIGMKTPHWGWGGTDPSSPAFGKLDPSPRRRSERISPPEDEDFSSRGGSFPTFPKLRHLGAFPSLWSLEKGSVMAGGGGGLPGREEEEEIWESGSREEERRMRRDRLAFPEHFLILFFSPISI